jgi:hypothetical protein
MYLKGRAIAYIVCDNGNNNDTDLEIFSYEYMSFKPYHSCPETIESCKVFYAFLISKTYKMATCSSNELRELHLIFE